MISIKLFTYTVFILILANAQEIKIKNDTSIINDVDMLSAEGPGKFGSSLMDKMKTMFRGKKAEPVVETEPPYIAPYKIPTNLFTKYHEQYTRRGYTFITPETTACPACTKPGFFRRLWRGVRRVAHAISPFNRKSTSRPHTFTVVYPDERPRYHTMRWRKTTTEAPDPNEGWDDDLFKNVRGQYKGRFTTRGYGLTDYLTADNRRPSWTYKTMSPEEREAHFGTKKTKKPKKAKTLSIVEQRRKEMQDIIDS